MKTLTFTLRSSLHLLTGLAIAGLAPLAVGQSSVRERDDGRKIRDREVVQERDRADNDRSRERVKLKKADSNFVEKVMQLSMEGIEVSRVAAVRTSNPRVRGFAETMAAEHVEMSKELSLIASNKGVVLPAKDNSADKWHKRQGKTFDVDYLKEMVGNHEETVKLFQRQALDGHDSELVAFARKHLSSMQQHLQVADDLHKMMK